MAENSRNEQNQEIQRLSSPGEDDICLEQIEISFALPCYVTPEQQQALWAIARQIVNAPVNQAKNHAHWLSGSGCKPHWSQADAVFLGKKAEPDAPDAGEPTFDENILVFESSFRADIGGQK